MPSELYVFGGVLEEETARKGGHLSNEKEPIPQIQIFEVQNAQLWIFLGSKCFSHGSLDVKL